MAFEYYLPGVAAPALIGLMLSVAIEAAMRPKPPMRRPLAAWAIHGGLWLIVYSALVLLIWRPWFAMLATSAILLMLVLVNNAKFTALREPFVFQDYEYFTDAIRHPRLYIPFLGWTKFLASAAGFLLAVWVGLRMETVPASAGLAAELIAAAAVLTGALLMLAAASRKRPALSFQPERDLVALGFLASLWHYGLQTRRPPTAVSPFSALVPRTGGGELPHLVAVQSESFFDPRPLFQGIRSDVLGEFDRLKRTAVAHGALTVPAWGANTVRTEFAFLTGLDEAQLGPHRFNPYRAIAAGWPVASLARFLKGMGYRTVCVHPYPASFYLRHRVFPALGFDEFLDIQAFAGAERFGPYVGDAAVAAKVADLLDKADGPLFVLAVTMENHGPLHLEQIGPNDVADLYAKPPPPGCDDLTIYLRHLRNADRMIGSLVRSLQAGKRKASLCWFGDHVPIMPSVYATFGEPAAMTDYVIWSNEGKNDATEAPLDADGLAIRWLRAMRLIA
jgi:hypothetical protein